MEKMVKNKDEIISMIPRHGEIAPDDIIQKMINKCNFTDSYAVRCSLTHHMIEFNIRDEWIKKVGFVQWTASPMIEMFQLLKTDKWLEVMSGSGYFGTTINKLYGTKVIMTDNHNEAWDKWHNDMVENLNAVDAIDKYRKEIKGVIMSWPPYETPDAFEVVKKCYELNLPLIYIGEGGGGCTADDDFFNYVYEHFESEPILEDTFRRFEGIHDYAILYRPIK